MSQSLSDIRDQSIQENTASKENGDISDTSSDFSSGSDSSSEASTNSNFDSEKQACQKFLKHLILLMQKILMMFGRNKKGIIVQIFCPIIFCTIIYLFSNLQPLLESQMKQFGWTHELTPVKKCFGSNCVSIGYSIIGDPQDSYQWIDIIMKNVAEDNQLKFNEDVKKQTVGSSQKFF